MGAGKGERGRAKSAAAAGVLWGESEMRPLAELRPHPRNARQHAAFQVGEIARSLKEFGWTFPVLVDESGLLIAGHGRVEAARTLGWTEAPTIVARGWSEAKVRAYMIADNKLALNAAWDEGLLAGELAGLRDDGVDLGLLGFQDEEVSRLLARLAGPDAPADFAAYGEEIQTEHQCPRCRYRWSGSSRPLEEEGGA